MANRNARGNHPTKRNRSQGRSAGWWLACCWVLVGTDACHAQFHAQALTDWFPEAGQLVWDAVISADDNQALIVMPGHLALYDLKSASSLGRRDLADMLPPEVGLDGFVWNVTASPNTRRVLVVAQHHRRKQVFFWLFGEELWWAPDVDSLASWRRDASEYASPLLVSDSGRTCYSILQDDQLLIESISLDGHSGYGLARLVTHRRTEAIWQLPDGRLACVQQSLPKTAGRVELWEFDAEKLALRRLSGLPGLKISDHYGSTHPWKALRTYRQNGAEHVTFVSPQSHRRLAILHQAMLSGEVKWASSAPVIAFSVVGTTANVGALYWVRFAGSALGPVVLRDKIGLEIPVCVSPTGDIVMTRESRHEKSRYLIRTVSQAGRPDSNRADSIRESSGN